ncbi:hypothetical protein BO82DRAFT_397983 [Aspergillus uvarum CBS 121591]|uniref:Uncharacterized protein n=1 Tax=Aspergillus uvarum CBS 121591 TaxID=1448315 RepID=A0A319CKZ7_9EURO|nr:hypothetical protein BO82DRAFT_397983 [Aspergillus uvarum CBS 121591]PYH86236.1 hypothetical protein BO82DRAFT_397983 [Aspergillus uvarum CBS 121591]
METHKALTLHAHTRPSPSPPPPAARNHWPRHATYAEYARLPLENLFVLDERVLLQERQFSIADLSCLAVSSVVLESGLLRLRETIGVEHVEESGLEEATEALEAGVEDETF